MRLVSRGQIAGVALALALSGCRGCGAQHGSKALAPGLATGCAHACARTARGGVACWGDNEHGQLGDGTASDHLRPAAVPGLAGVVDVTATCFGTCALLEEGTVRCWGKDHGQAPVALSGPRGVVGIDGGNSEVCAVGGDGRVSCWGGGAEAEEPRPVPEIRGALAVAVGEGNACVLLEGGAVSCWGAENERGQLGDGSTEDRAKPTRVADVRDAADVAIGRGGGCAVLRGGEVRCWGFAAIPDDACSSRRISSPSGVSGVIQTFCPQPRPLPDVDSARAVSIGSGMYAVLEESGAVLTWDPFARRGPSPVAGALDAIGISAGSSFACVRRSGGAVACFGDNDAGQLGDGTTTSRREARDVALP